MRITVNYTRAAYSLVLLDRYSAPLEPAHRERLVEALSTWNFRPHTLDEADLFRCACLLFEAVLRIKGLAELGISQGEKRLADCWGDDRLIAAPYQTK